VSRGSDQRIADVLDAIDRCRRYVGALTDDDPDLVQMAEDAIERNLQIIGEAANHLPAEVTEAHPEIAWPQICGFRNILVHQYFGVDAVSAEAGVGARVASADTFDAKLARLEAQAPNGRSSRPRADAASRFAPTARYGMAAMRVLRASEGRSGWA